MHIIYCTVNKLSIVNHNTHIISKMKRTVFKKYKQIRDDWFNTVCMELIDSSPNKWTSKLEHIRNKIDSGYPDDTYILVQFDSFNSSKLSKHGLNITYDNLAKTLNIGHSLRRQILCENHILNRCDVILVRISSSYIQLKLRVRSSRHNCIIS
jgi:hypothetical protein